MAIWKQMLLSNFWINKLFFASFSVEIFYKSLHRSWAWFWIKVGFRPKPSGGQSRMAGSIAAQAFVLIWLVQHTKDLISPFRSKLCPCVSFWLHTHTWLVKSSRDVVPNVQLNVWHGLGSILQNSVSAESFLGSIFNPKILNKTPP
jgi:hypothetical protein